MEATTTTCTQVVDFFLKVGLNQINCIMEKEREREEQIKIKTERRRRRKKFFFYQFLRQSFLKQTVLVNSDF